MNRELKFRVWDTDKNCFVKGKYISVSQYCDEQGLFTLQEDLDKSIFQQYTGLKDKNGKEIYEGDFVKLCRSYNYGWLRRGEIFPIIWNNDELSFNLGSGQLTKSKKVEIVGNIFENPELLNN